MDACKFLNMHTQKVYKHYSSGYCMDLISKKNQKPSAVSLTVNRYQFKSEIDAFNFLIIIFNWISGFFDPGIFQIFHLPIWACIQDFEAFSGPENLKRASLYSLFNAVTRMFLRNIYCMKIFGRGG